MSTFQLEIVTPTRIYDEGEVSYVRCPGIDGLFGVLANHTKSVFALTVGEIKIIRDNETRYFATSGGYAEVTGKKVQLLLESAERSDEIDVERAKEAIQRARERLAQKHKIDVVRAESSLQRALNRLRVAQR
ncbi:MAG: F0F1 ATP synthase subunit epsilon [FCB group bacterium]|nr:F0F1 ATP synthase subunit epsilon [FCB group bacterium]